MSLRDFLEAHGLQAYVATFEARHVPLEELPQLADDELREDFGMTSYVDRKRFRAAVAGFGDGSDSLSGATRVGGAPDAPDALSGTTRVAGTPAPAAALAGATRVGGTLVASETGTSPAREDTADGLPRRLGSYRVLGVVGAGGMGRVVRARHVEEGWATRQGGDVAIKLVHTHLAADPVFRERFLAEADLGRRMQHPVLVPTWDVVSEGPWLGTVMSFVEGEPLSARVRPEGVSVEDVVRLLEPIGAALDHLHAQGVVHRDVKPANIVVRPDGRTVLLDLGIAKDSSAGEGQTRTSTAMGTSAWMAPEQADAKHVDGAADRYAFGMMAYALLSGRMPWDAATSEARVLVSKMTGHLVPLRKARPDVPPAVADAVMRMVSLAPEARFASCAEFANVLAGRVAAAAAPAPVAGAPAAPQAMQAPGAVGLSRDAMVGTRGAVLVDEAATAVELAPRGLEATSSSPGASVPMAVPAVTPAPAAPPSVGMPPPPTETGPRPAESPSRARWGVATALLALGGLATALLALGGLAVWQISGLPGAATAGDPFDGNGVVDPAQVAPGRFAQPVSGRSVAPDRGPAVPILSVTASSELAPVVMGGIAYAFRAAQLVDGRLDTSWQPARDGRTQVLHLTYAPCRVGKLRLANGFQSTDANGDMFVKNRRVARVTVRTSNGYTRTFDVPDLRGWSGLTLDDPNPSESLDLTIDSFHASAEWEDVALSEVALEAAVVTPAP